MYAETELWRFETARFAIVWTVLPSYHLDLSWDETGEVREGLESGRLEAFDSKVAVYLDGKEIAADYLGESIYENPLDFRDHIGLAAKRRADGRNYGSYFADMVWTAISEARETLEIYGMPRPRV